jgi:uroporphyrin-III C-methyltransferase
VPIDDGQIRMKPKVYLIGAGPGDPELLTVKAHRILRRADVVLHDELVSRGILDLVRPSARVQNIGKRCGRQSIRQEEIHSRMVSCAREGLTVVRLKGGDPLVFGRANEEIAALRACGVEFEIIPGVTAALAAAASARISLTDRRLASRVTFLTNHWCAGKAAPDMTHEASSGATVVVYMPGGDNALLSRRLQAAGFNGDTPCVIVSRASTSEEVVLCTTVAELPKTPHLPAPCVLLAGAVVAAAICPRREDEAEAEALLGIAAANEDAPAC